MVTQMRHIKLVKICHTYIFKTLAVVPLCEHLPIIIESSAINDAVYKFASIETNFT
ncbi:hypothetical protein CPter91_1080 [Collimonas pratensis]|uniref:Uncharacterized protein n=1 Tax=Collimonas pratensis TaxID=279113 RepID=A0A127Q0U2_9BURK|nr:hypothetical protein CPter91_1080 [Collimonas pratensis]